MAHASDDHTDKALWLTLAQSWVRLAEHVTRAESPARGAEDASEATLAVHSPD